jgi:CRP/FNR family transcriptional regulator
VRPHGACRAAIIETLHAHPHTLAELAEALPCPPTCLAMNLTRLRDTGVIACRTRSAQAADRSAVVYELNPGATLPTSRLYQLLTATDLVMLATAAQPRQYEPGELIFLEGSACEGLYLVDSGLVRLSVQGEDSVQSSTVRQQIIELAGPGACIGALAAVDSEPQATTAEAVERTTLLLIPLPVVQELLKSSPTFASAMGIEISASLRHTLAMVQDLSLRPVDSRVAKVLLQRMESQSRPGVGAGAYRRARLTQQELAEMAGTVREVAARSLKRLECRGAIRIDGGQVIIVDQDELCRAL